MISQTKKRMVSSVPRKVVAELVLLLKRLLRNVSIAAHCETVREDKQIQISGRIDAIVESLKLVGELVDCRARQSRSQRGQEVVQRVQTLVAA